MFSAQYINSIHICKGNQGKFYVLDGIKYDIHFPLVWALDHHNYEPYYDEETNQTYINGSGPNECDNCNEHGDVNGVFVGYCSSCLEHVYHGKREEEELKARKADEERKEDEEYNKYKEEFEKDFERMNLEDDEERYREERYGIQLEKFKDVCCRD